MHVLKSFFIAFSMYSTIPVPQFEWKEEDMRYIFCFFPWIGAVIGGCIYVWDYLCRICLAGSLCHAVVAMALPLLLTGGIHADGFMDTMDAIHSYRPREKKLEILKDSHIGAFAVIMLAAYGLVWIGAFSEITDPALFKIICGGFFLSRCLCGISVVSFPLAKKEGMLYQFADSSRKQTVKISLYIQSVVCIGWMCVWSFYAGLFVAAAAIAALFRYKRRTGKEFGGITGDTSGYFILLSEIYMITAAALVAVIK